MNIYILCGGYYDNFSYPKSLTEINGERLLDRTIRLLPNEPIVCINMNEEGFTEYNTIKCNFTYNHVKKTGHYLDVFDAAPHEECIFLFGDVYYTEDAVKKIISTYETTKRNIFICNQYPFNEKHLRQGEPFGWIVKDPEEFKHAVKLCKKLECRKLIDHSDGVASNWELAHVINGLGVNDFNLRKEDCLIIDDLTIDVDDPSVIKKIENERR